MVSLGPNELKTVSVTVFIIIFWSIWFSFRSLVLLVSQIVEHTEIDEHLEETAENLIVEHLFCVSTRGITSMFWLKYCQTSNISCTWEGNKIVDQSDVVGASPVGAAPSTSLFSTSHLTSMDWANTTLRRDENHLSFGIWCVWYKRLYGTSDTSRFRTNTWHYSLWCYFEIDWFVNCSGGLCRTIIEFKVLSCQS